MAEVALEALRNARDLFDDGILLFQNQRFPRAFALIGLAADELGKHILCTSFYGTRDGSDEDWRVFWRRFRRHQEKLGNSLFSAWAGDLLSDAVPDVEAFHQLRLSATYVDIDGAGLVVTPQSCIDAAEVERAINQIGPEIAFCESVLRRATPSQLAHVLESLQTSEQAVELRSKLAMYGPWAPAAAAIGLKVGMPMEEVFKFIEYADEHRFFDGLAK